MKRLAALGFVVLGAPALRAHQPTMSDGTAVSPDAAIKLDDIQLSRVVYHEVTGDSPMLWIEFEIEEPQSLRISLGMPLLERLASFRPAFAVVGPGFPDAVLPFEIPEGLGAVRFDTDEVVEPEVFYEPFSRTSSWILREENVELPLAGTYFIVAFVPSGETGKLWIAPGVREEFGLADIVKLSGVLGEVRAFHESGGGAFPCLLFPLAVLLAVLTGLSLLRKGSPGSAVAGRE